ncbi:MAG: DNA recombination protein RmuC [Rickettsiales bacterium]|jgi:DNA recombination protein RmuC|nr:DNA recombination protein RmuC [Rickettsiales bacterium]
MFSFALISIVILAVFTALTVKERNELRKKADELRENKTLLEKNISGLAAEYRLSQDKNGELWEKIKNYEKIIEEKNALMIENEKYKTQLLEREKSLISQGETIEKMKNEMLLQFKNISSDVARQQKNDFDAQQKNSLLALLSPLNQQLQDFNKNVNENRIEIRERINALIDRAANIGNKADNLAEALRGDKKIQGNWGELRLINLLETAGLKKGEDFFVQKAERDKKGEIFIFDCVMKIPDDKYLIIDSKVSIVNYEKRLAAESKEERENFLKLYCGDIKNHIEELGKKEYHTILKANSPDFVFMFLPLENAYFEAIDFDRGLLEFAMKNNVAMVTPSIIAPAINMVKNLWSIEKQNKNTKEIVKLAERIYNKVINFMGKIGEIEKNLDNAQRSCGEARNYLQSGKGNVLKTAQDMASLINKNDEKGDLLLENDGGEDNKGDNDGGDAPSLSAANADN